MSTAVATAPLNYRAKINPHPQFYLFSPADVRLECDVRAETFVFPTSTESACAVYSHPSAPCRPENGSHGPRCPWRDTGLTPMVGVLPIRELHGMINPKGGQTLNGMTAQEVVEAIIGNEGIGGKLGKHGIRILFGDERDELVRQDATVAYRDAKYRMALSLKGSHLSINAKQLESNLPPIAPSKATMAAMDYIARYEGEFRPTSRYQCAECGWPFDEQRALDSHIKVQHRAAASKYGLTGQPDLAKGPEGFTPARQPDLTEGAAAETMRLLLEQVADLTAKVQGLQEDKTAKPAPVAEPRARKGR